MQRAAVCARVRAAGTQLDASWKWRTNTRLSHQSGDPHTFEFCKPRRRDKLNDELAAKQARDKQVLDCAEQARRTTQDFGKYATGFGPPPSVTGSSNHYNQKLGKCIVDVQTVDKSGTAEFALDSYEQSDILFCTIHFGSKQTPMQRTCMDHQNNQPDSSEADKRIDALLKG